MAEAFSNIDYGHDRASEIHNAQYDRWQLGKRRDGDRANRPLHTVERQRIALFVQREDHHRPSWGLSFRPYKQSFHQSPYQRFQKYRSSNGHNDFFRSKTGIFE